MSNRRVQRVSEFIRREVCLALQKEIKDPRIGFITVLDCKVTSDLKEAKVYVSVMGDGKTKKKSMDGLNSSAPYIQGHIAKVAELRHTPKISFFLDKSVDKAARIDELLKKVKNG